MRNPPAGSMLDGLGGVPALAVALLALALLAAAPLAGWAALAAEEPHVHPNVVFILADDLGYGDLGCYGQQKIQTPHLDRLADEGIRFTQFYSGSAFCCPSRCVLLTGFHTGHSSVRSNGGGPLRPEEITIGETLRRTGYRTCCIGKWGIDRSEPGAPNRAGFDDFFGLLDGVQSWNYYPESIYRNDKVVRLRNVVKNGVATVRVDYTHDLYIEEALRFIRRRKARPFFLYLSLQLVHLNNAADREGRDSVPSPDGHQLRAGHEGPDFGVYGDRPWPGPMRGRAAMIHRMDAGVGRILALLSDLEIDEQTVVMFSSDNGPEDEDSADPNFFASTGGLRGAKGSLWEGGIRVPLIVRWPGTIPAGRVTDHVAAFQDVLPTLAELSKAASPRTDGISLMPLLAGKPDQQERHDHLYFNLPMRGGLEAVRLGKWKGLRQGTATDPAAPVRLFDLEKDVAESTDLADLHPEVVQRMKQLMEASYIPLESTSDDR